MPKTRTKKKPALQSKESDIPKDIPSVTDIKFARVIFSDKTLDILPIEKIKNYHRRLNGSQQISDFVPSNAKDFLAVKFAYAAETLCPGHGKEIVPGNICDRENPHKHYRPVSILNLAGEHICITIIFKNFFIIYLII